MTQVFDPNHCRSALVFVRDNNDTPMRRRTRSGAIRGTCPYLGRKGSDLSIYARRLGHFPSRAETETGLDAARALGMGSTSPHGEFSTSAIAAVSVEAPRLYHGLPSGAEGEEMPAESTRAIDSLATELTAIEGRLQHRASTDTGPVPSSLRSRPEPSSRETNKTKAWVDSRPGEPSPSSNLSDHATDDDRPQDAESRRWDEFGRDAQTVERFAPIARVLAKGYFRTVVTGTEHLPAHGPCLLVANHSGALPIDGLVLACALSQASQAPRNVRWLTEDFVQNLPFVGTFLQRLGAVRASRENALRLLQRGECVVAFPEGFKGYAKPVAHWYRVQRLGRGRIVALCLQAGVPLYPCAIVGGEEATPSLRRLEAMERWLGTPYFPITPTFPWLGPLGLLPMPSRWHIDIGPAFLTGNEPGSSDDPLYIAELTNRLRTVLQERLDRLLRRRQSTWS